MKRSLPVWQVGLALIVLFALMPPRTAAAQGFSDRLRGVTAGLLKVSLFGATAIDLEAAGLETIDVGELVFGVASVDVADETALRVRAYLYNPDAAPAAVPVPGVALFVLVDERGRKIELQAVEVEDLPRGADAVSVPGLERTNVSLIFSAPPSGALLGALKVGPLGVIQDIPLHSSALPAGAGNAWSQPAPPAGGNVWSQPAGGSVARSAPAGASPPASSSPAGSPPSNKKSKN
ncbi:MAG: hypothetical protein ABR559_10295 [Gemmatimonadota bacterium]